MAWAPIELSKTRVAIRDVVVAGRQQRLGAAVRACVFAAAAEAYHSFLDGANIRDKPRAFICYFSSSTFSIGV